MVDSRKEFYTSEQLDKLYPEEVLHLFVDGGIEAEDVKKYWQRLQIGTSDILIKAAELRSLVNLQPTPLTPEVIVEKIVSKRFTTREQVAQLFASQNFGIDDSNRAPFLERKNLARKFYRGENHFQDHMEKALGIEDKEVLDYISNRLQIDKKTFLSKNYRNHFGKYLPLLKHYREDGLISFKERTINTILSSLKNYKTYQQFLEAQILELSETLIRKGVAANKVGDLASGLLNMAPGGREFNELSVRFGEELAKIQTPEDFEHLEEVSNEHVPKLEAHYSTEFISF